MGTHEPSPILIYHQRSSLSRSNLRRESMDWRNKPSCPKRYPGLPRLKLQPAEDLPEAPLSDLTSPLGKSMQVTLGNLSTLLFLAYSVTAQYRGMGETLSFLSCPSAGALYPCELYVQSDGIADLPDGLHHYDPFAYEFRHLRQSAKPFFGLTIYITAVFHRVAWKYGVRAYRYCLMDTGHLLENLLLSARSLGIVLQPVYDFPDREINRHLCLDSEREACLAIVTSDSNPLPPTGRLQANESELVAAKRCAKTDHPSMEFLEAHAATSEPFARPLDLISLASGLQKPPVGLGAYAQATQHRRSLRKFAPETLAQAQLDMLLFSLASLETGGVVRLGLMTERVQGLIPGLYSLEAGGRLKLLLGRSLARELASACLGQAWIAQAALVVLVWADLSALEQEIGPRAYRLAHILSGQIGQRAYLAASTLGLGCCGVGAFFDDNAGQVLDLTPNEQLLYLLAFGPVRK